ncbi:hypothetical protein HOY80DRAFT_1002023 [Tuber brumale]|nr:hypothetical protein HOY80DRAFT_1002023 [Tuber brumale]
MACEFVRERLPIPGGIKLPDAIPNLPWTQMLLPLPQTRGSWEITASPLLTVDPSDKNNKLGIYYKYPPTLTAPRTFKALTSTYPQCQSSPNSCLASREWSPRLKETAA